LNALPENDPMRDQVSRRIKENRYQLRDMLIRAGMDVCSDPECVEPGTNTANGQQWCPEHKP
jgi:hypothetical protein